MKFESIFAFEHRQSSIHNQEVKGGISYPFGCAVNANILPSVSLTGPLSLCGFGWTLASSGKRTASLIYIYQISFKIMPKSNEICGRAKYSSTNARRNRAKSVSIATIQLQCSNPYSIPSFSDILNECKRKFDEETVLKNEAYSFIASKGLFKEFINSKKRMSPNTKNTNVY